MILFIKRMFQKFADYFMYQYLQYKLAQQLVVVTSAEIESLRSAVIALEEGAIMIRETEQAIKENTI